ncbi:uncharacterized protein LOC143871132 isoform X2 [Tasmannia lanceolata]|uniref:uncharacterized protein LOC143871132 isoform X2 n=3 Tax=Tasmannia lanceolata TaxID=3420 RepID=UPI004064438C
MIWTKVTSVLRLMVMAKDKFYVVFKGRQVGIFESWADCHLQVNRYSGASYRSYATRNEAEASLNAYIESHEDLKDKREEDIHNVPWFLGLAIGVGLGIKMVADAKITTSEVHSLPDLKDAVLNIDGFARDRGGRKPFRLFHSSFLHLQSVTKIKLVVHVCSIRYHIDLKQIRNRVMDRSWIQLDRDDVAYEEGVKEFIEFAFANTPRGNKIICPCNRCVLVRVVDQTQAEEHLLWNGMLKGYTRWYFHGEGSSSAASEGDRPHHDDSSRHDGMHDLLHDTFRVPRHDEEVEPADDEFDPGDDEVGPGVAAGKGPDADAQNFFRLLQDAEHDLYPGSKLSKLNFVVRLFHIKCLNGWRNKSFTMLLELLKEALPEGESLPNSFYETKKIIRDLGLHYNKIDACPNDCMLYWKEVANDSACRICGASRWKSTAQNSNNDRSSSSTGVHKVSAKILRHFPLKPRLQRLYMSKKTASFMTWHDVSRTKDGLLRHPADSTAWKILDYKYLVFSSEPRNVRLGLASDGFNPFRTMSIAHSTWPVILMPYNLPPWMCMKQPYMMLSLLNPGPSAPGNDIDVYLQPLIEELKELWEDGLQTYDASRNETFRMHAAVLWTISDFPAYANLSGWSTKGKLACPSCNKDTCSCRLKHGKKECYMGHRRFLTTNHKF